MSQLINETVTGVHHWNDSLFSFKTTRNAAFRFRNGHFVMLGIEDQGKPLMRAYSIASANYEDELEFFSIKVADGALTSKLQHLRVGDNIYLSKKPTGTLVADRLLPGRRLYLLSTGTGLAPFISIVKDPEIYQQFDEVILAHGLRYPSELAYRQLIEETLPQDPYLGEMVRRQLHYYPTVTREKFKRNGRLTDLLSSGRLFHDLDLPQATTEDDRFMLCGSPSMLKDFGQILQQRGFCEARSDRAGHYVVERAFVEA